MEKIWDAETSKWKAAITKGLNLSLKRDENILYLGASSGTTINHLSDQTNGIIFGVEKSFQMAIPFIKLAKAKNNISPIFCNAREIDYIKKRLFDQKIDILFCDIPSQDQIEILINSSKLIDKKSKILFSLKTQSISQENPYKIYDESKEKLKKHFRIIEETNLEPFHKKHWFFVLKKK
jgi:fibrillarin-like pre-rRNA processing protein